MAPVFAGSVVIGSVAPKGEFKTLGEVAMVNGAVVVTAKEAKPRVEGNGPAVEVVKGKTITVNGQPQRAPAPQGGAGSGAAGISSTTAVQIGFVAGSPTSTMLSATAISRAGDAKDAAESASSTASDAESAASDAAAATTAAGGAANAAGCAINEVTGASVHTRPRGFSCA